MTTIERDIRTRFAQYADFTETQISEILTQLQAALAHDFTDDTVVTSEEAIIERIDCAVTEAEDAAYNQAASAIAEDAWAYDMIVPEQRNAWVKLIDRVKENGF